MKKLFVYRIKSNIWWNILKIRYYQFLGYQIFIWGGQSLPINDFKLINFPSASLKSIEYEQDNRKLSAEYFKNINKNWSTDIFRSDYIRKTIDIYGLDYYAFEKTLSKLISDGDKVQKIAPPFINAVFENRRPSVNFWVLVYYPIWIMRLTAIFLNNLFLSLISRSNISIPPIVYFRKKIEPDNGECGYLCEELNSEKKKLILGIYPFSSKQTEKFGFYFISSFQGNTLRLIKSYTSSLFQSFSDMIFYFKNGVDESIFKKCLNDTYAAKVVTNLSPSIICGVLVDKPMFILMSKYKGMHTRMVSLNESFFFPPNRSFDFSHLDQYYSMNEIDERMQNIYGGKIKSYKQVEFFRKGGGESKGISNDLAKAFKSFKYSVVIAPAQVNVEKSGFYYWDYDDMESFIKSSLSLAKEFTDTLFIVKGKKGELKLLPEWFQEISRQSQNIFIIYCDKPKELEYNKFEDLIDVADLVISMCLTSTTIWQSIARNKPAIAINRSNFRTALTDHKGYECDLAGMHEKISYWQSLSSSEVHQSTEKMKTIFNIGNSNGLSQIAEDLRGLLECK